MLLDEHKRIWKLVLSLSLSLLLFNNYFLWLCNMYWRKKWRFQFPIFLFFSFARKRQIKNMILKWSLSSNSNSPTISTCSLSSLNSNFCLLLLLLIVSVWWQTKEKVPLLSQLHWLSAQSVCSSCFSSSSSSLLSRCQVNLLSLTTSLLHY